MPYRYIPVVRTKVGEAEALEQLTATAKARMFPLVVMNRVVPSTFLPNMIQRLSGYPLALSGSYHHSVTGSVAAFISLYQSLGTGGIPVIPSIPLNADPAYLAAVGGIVGSFAPGVVVSTSLADIPNVLPWITAQGWVSANVDLLVQIGDVAQHAPAPFGSYVAHTLNGSIGHPHIWRSVTLNSYAAPRDHTNLPPGRSLVPRRDWQLWSHVAPAVAFQLDYSDWGHVHASLDDVPGYAMANATVSVRYAVDDYWIVRKGVQTSGPNGQQMSVQYRNHAIALANEPLFNAIPGGCWGDTRIQHYATTAGGTGGRPQWAALLLNRHLSLVADRLP